MTVLFLNIHHLQSLNTMKLHLPLRLLSALLAVLAVPCVCAATLQRGTGSPEEISSLLEELYADNIILTIEDGDDISTVRNAKFTGDADLTITGGQFTLGESDKNYPSATGGIGLGSGTVTVEMSGGKLVQEAFTYMGENGKVDIKMSGSAIYENAGTIGADNSVVNISMEGDSLLKLNVPDGKEFGNFNGYVGRDNSTVNITVKDKARVEVGRIANIGQIDSNVTINVEGGTVSLSKMITIGAAGSTVNLNISDGLFESKEGIRIGSYAGSKFNVKVTGGKLDLQGGKGSIGSNYSVTDFEVSGGEVVIGTHLLDSSAGAEIRVTGGLMTIGNGVSGMDMGGESCASGINISVSGDGKFYHRDKTKIMAGTLTMSDQGIYEWENGTYNTGSYEKIVMKGGKLVNAARCKQTDVIIDTTAKFSGDLVLGGISAGYIKQVNTRNAVTITDLAANASLELASDTNSMVAGDMHLGLAGVTAQQAMIDFSGGTLSLTGKLTFDFTLDAMNEISDGEFSIYLTNAGFACDDLEQHFFLAEGWFDSWEVVKLENGVITFRGVKSDRVLEITQDEVFDDTAAFDKASKVVVDADASIELDELDGETSTVLRQLTGNGSLGVTNNDADDTLKMELENKNSGAGANDGDTTFGGSISTKGNVNLVKTGDAALTVDGDVQTQSGLGVAEGKLTLNGSDNSASHLTEVEGDLIINGALAVADNSDLTGNGGSISGSGSLELGGDLALGKDMTVSDVQMVLGPNAKLITNGADVNIQALQGSGEVDGSVTVSAGSGTFSGTMSGRLLVSGKAEQTLADGAYVQELSVSGGKLELHVIGGYAAANPVTAEQVSINGASQVVFHVHFDGEAFELPALYADKVTIDAGSKFSFQNVNDVQPGGALKCVLLTTEELKGDVSSVATEFSPLFKLYYTNLRLETQQEDVALYANDGASMTSVMLLGDVNENNNFDAVALSGNALAGARMIFASRYHPDMITAGSALNAVATRAMELADTNPAAASRVLAAVAGSTVTALGAAQRDALRGELLRRHAHAAVAQVEKDKVHTWIEANGMFNKLNSEGDRSGYRLNSWGGTVGACMNTAQDVTLGLALSAQYGDLKAAAADSAEGDLDGSYLTFFARAKEGEWGHSFTATLGRHEARLNRTVDFGTGAYRAHGKTDGTGFGAMYELTRDVLLKEDKSSILQPLMSVSIVTTSMGAYSESGSAGSAGLNVAKQKWTTGSVAIGARWLGSVGEAVFGKKASAELRANIAQDMGDHQGTANVALLATPAFRQRVHGAEMGTTAFQIGAGVALPVAEQAHIYTNASVDFRSGAHQWNVNFGLSVGF